MSTQLADLTPAVQDYVRAIYLLELDGARVSTSALAKRMRVSAPSATAMAKRLSELDLVERTPYRGLVLTAAGRRVALELLRHHRLLERFLVDTLGLTLDQVHDEADRLEHALSEVLEARIDATLGFPTHDPHGDPIPDVQLNLISTGGRRLSEVSEGERVTVRVVPDEDASLLSYLDEIGVLPGAELELLTRAPFAGPLTLRTGAGETAVSRELANRVGVS